MKNKKRYSDSGNYTLGFILVLIGAILLLKKLDIFYFDWMISWPMIFVVVGLFTLIRTKFDSAFGWFMLLFGSFFLSKKYLPIPVEYEPFVIPVGLILLGLYFLISRNKKSIDWSGASGDGFVMGSNDKKSDSTDHININCTFAGVDRKLLSKDFHGGKINTTFGGVELDLTQADLAADALLKIEVTFGGLVLVLPPHWDVDIEVSNVFAGVEDKRPFPQAGVDKSKVLKIRGAVSFGGLEIKSY